MPTISELIPILLMVALGVLWIKEAVNHNFTSKQLEENLEKLLASKRECTALLFKLETANTIAEVYKSQVNRYEQTTYNRMKAKAEHRKWKAEKLHNITIPLNEAIRPNAAIPFGNWADLSGLETKSEKLKRKVAEDMIATFPAFL